MSRMSAVPTFIAVCVCLCLAALVATGPAFGAQDGLAPDVKAVLADPDLRDYAIEQDLRFRETLSLDSRRSWVEELYDQPEATIGTRFFGALLTDEELREVRIRLDLEADANLVEDWYRERPDRLDQYGGVRIDHAAGGKLAVYLLPDAGSPWQGSLKHPG